MDGNKGILAEIGSNPELVEKVKAAWKAEAGADELAGLLVAHGIEVTSEQVEAYLGERQAEAGRQISDAELDDEALAAVAGGGTGVDCTMADDCDLSFKYYWFFCSQNGTNERCYYNQCCDESDQVNLRFTK